MIDGPLDRLLETSDGRTDRLVTVEAARPTMTGRANGIGRGSVQKYTGARNATMPNAHGGTQIDTIGHDKVDSQSQLVPVL